MSVTDYSSSTQDDPVDTWSSCNVSLDLKKKIAYEPSLDAKHRGDSKIEHNCCPQKVLSFQQHPPNFESTLKSLDTLEKSNLRKKNEHEAALQNFKTELGDLHKSSDEKIEELEKNVQITIDKTHKDVENEKRNFCEIACVDDEKYECLECTVELMLSKAKDNIDQLSERIRVIERDRQCHATKIFKKFFQILRRLCYLPADEQKSFFEKEIAVYNQTILENNKNYEKTKLKFRLTVDLLKQNLYIWLRDVKDDRNAVCRKNALDDFYCEYEKFNNAGSTYMKKLEGKTALCRLEKQTTEVSGIVSQWDLSIPFPATRFDDQLTQFNTQITSTDSTITSFIRSYKFYVTKYLGRLLVKVKKLRSIVEMMGCEEETEDEELTIVENIYEKAKKQVDDFTEELETIWGNTLEALNRKGKELLQIFIEFGSPWDVLSETFLKQQDAVAQQLDNRVVKSEKSHSDLEQKIMVEVPKMREEENTSKLEKKLNQVVAILEKKGQKYKSDHEEDCKIIKKATEFMRKEIVTMATKVDKFLQANKSILDESSMKDNESTITSYESNQSVDCFENFKFEEIIIHDLELIGNQVNALDDWKLKFIKNMVSYRPSFEKEIIEVVELWQDKLISGALENLERSLKSVEDLQFDIRRDVYDVRYNELIRHQKDLEHHVKTINGLLTESTKCISSLFTFSDIIDDYKAKATKLIKERSRTIKHSSQINCLQNTLTNMKNISIEDIERRMNNGIERILKNISVINNQNDSFFSEITLFNNGGSYSSEEYNLAKKEMTALIKNIEKDESTNRLAISKMTDEAILEINNFDKTTNENLSITFEKLKIQEDVTIALTTCEKSVTLKIELTIHTNREMMDKITQFTEKCVNKADVNEVIFILDETITHVIKTLDLMKGPFPDIEIPKELESTFNNVKYNATKNGNSKKRAMSVKSLANEQANNVQDTEFPCSPHNFPSTISTYIFDALAEIKDKAMIYYTVLINKNDELPFTNQNIPCETCINNSLEKLNTIYNDTYNFWIEGANCLAEFFESIEMPSIEWYLRDEENSESVITSSPMGKDPNQYVSNKLNENVTGFESTLREMLGMLQSKHTSGPLTSDKSEIVQ